MSPARPLSDSERRDWIRLSRTQNVGPVTFAQLLKRFGSPAAAIDALSDIARRAGRGRPSPPRRLTRSRPGSPLDRRAAGTNALLYQGASLVRHAADVIEILSSLRFGHVSSPETPPYDPESHDDPCQTARSPGCAKPSRPTPCRLTRSPAPAGSARRVAQQSLQNSNYPAKP